MAKTWERVKFEIIQERYTYEPHRPGKIAIIPWLVCEKCGLVYVRNALTSWCIQKGCQHDLHPEYRNKIKELSKNNG